MKTTRCLIIVFALALIFTPPVARGADDKLPGLLRDLDARVLGGDPEKAKQLSSMLYQDARARIREANERETKVWRQISNRGDWEKYRDPRIQALREAVGQYPPVPKDLKVRVTRKLEGDGYRIENLVFESRPGLLVTANLYLPAEPTKAIPGIVICSSHHNPKTQGELQDMGMNWARLGCMVIVPDNLGHGERRQHPFVSEKSYPGSFRVGRQDYYFRYNVGMQLHAIGDTLVGWIAWDLMRCADLLLAREGIDKERIILLGAVAGGGDPAGVAAALDPRFTAVVPFNFGGPQPETTFPLPEDAENRFNYAGGGSWESTRNIRLSARDGFLPWVIVGSVAPRGLIHAHEFAWDQERDPVWTRYQKIFGFYDARDRLDASKGKGSVGGKPPESSHCNNIGPLHRQGMYPALKRWFNMPIPEKEFSQRRPSSEELLCLPPEMKPRPVHELAAELGADRAAAARKRLAALEPQARREQLRKDWARLLGAVENQGDAMVAAQGKQRVGDVTVEKLALTVSPGIEVPMLLLLPGKVDAKPPVVVAFAQEGKQAFLKNRADVIAELLAGGVAVCLPDLRGTGESRPGDGRGRSSSATSISATELMVGRTLVGLRLADLRSVLRHLEKRGDVDGSRIALWGDSFAPVNGKDRELAVPLDAEKMPDQSEPLGSILALLAGLYEGKVRAIHGHGGMTGYQTLLGSQFCYFPHDVIVPGALTAGDLNDVAAAIAPRPLRLTGMVDGLNRRVADAEIAKTFEPALANYRAAKANDRLVLEADGNSDTIARWFITQLK